MLGNGPHLVGIMLHSALCRIRHYVAFGVMLFSILSFGIMSHSGLCHSAMCRIRHYVAFGLMSFGYAPFGVMLLGLMSFGVMSFGLLSVV